ncbi:MAG TPA: type IV pilus biogenesis protein PilP [Rhodospirillaceae bacterium]|nr:MAG: hypothetical protein A2018_06605 [Alphaproteobacteria bacterium GWF2_58_20]HAU29854.1 type IV pilus biogenesis protein PilP [Rhodospirillaceae bacterium]
MSVKHIALASLGLLILPACPDMAMAQQAPAFQLQGAPAAIGSIPSPQEQVASTVRAQVPMATKLPVHTNLLKAVMDQQEQMLLLDLEIKKATLEKQLREVQGEILGGKDTSMKDVDRLLQNNIPATPAINVEDMGGLGDEPAVMRISKQNDELVAMIKTPDGGVMLASKGTILPGGWKITAITSASASASQDGKKAVQLKFDGNNNKTSGSTGNLGGIGSSSSSIIRSSGMR